MKITSILLLAIVVLFAYDGIRMMLLFRNTVKLEERVVPFDKLNPQAKMRILVLGDSTAFGTGVTDTKFSTAGRLYSAYPQAELINMSENGLKLKGLNELIKDVDTHFDIIVIQIGANDIIRITPRDAMEKELQKLLAKTKSLGDKVVILHSGDIGESKFFPIYVRRLLTTKTKQVREMYIKNAEAYGASYVDLFNVELPQDKYASDKLHLTDEGYGIWFDEIMKKLK